MIIFSKIRSSNTIFFHDVLMVPIAWLGAYWLRFNLSEMPEGVSDIAISWLPLVVVIQAIASSCYGLYRGVWRFASIPDLIRIMKAVLSATLIIGLALFFYNRLEGVPRSVLPLYAVLLILLLSTPRFLYRIWKDRTVSSSGKRALVIGAGAAGEQLVRDLLRKSGAEFNPVIFVDDDKSKRKREIRGIRVVGSVRNVSKLVERHQIETILIAIPSASDSDMRRVVEICEASGVPFLTLPSVDDMLSGRVTGETLREVSIDDLLGRDCVKLEWDRIANSLSDRRILVTGGGGSIGSELCRQLARLSPAELIVFEKSEYNLYKIDGELRAAFPKLLVHSILGDVAERKSLDNVMAKFQPEIVFHAAAYKHVPLLETQAREAANNNIIGSCNVAQASIEAGVEQFVLISTDKAVNPTNIMGATKKVAEIFCQACAGESKTRFTTVRFGNVLGSAGSVVPLFQEQIKRGGPVTITHPDITRYFMTIPEACQLIMEASSIGRGGEIFVLDMGEPIKISYLAEQMIRLSGKKPNKDIEIKYIGLRPGEKLYEELFHDEENLKPSGHDKLFFAASRSYKKEHIDASLQALKNACDAFDDERIRSIIRELVPEYKEDKAVLELADKAAGDSAALPERRQFTRAT